MTHTRFSLIFLLSIFGSYSFSQTKTFNTFGSAGSSFRSSELVLDFTIGEVFTQTFTNKGITLTQGQHQQDKVILTASKAIIVDFSNNEVQASNSSLFELKAFPNPFQSSVTIQSSEAKDLAYTIYNTQGQLITSGTLSDLNNKIDLESLITGTYYFVYQTDMTIGQISLIKL